jgi:hypothetical protein
MNIHDELKLVQCWGKFVLMGSLARPEYQAVRQLLDALSLLLTPSVVTAELPNLRLSVLRALVAFEHHFPKTEHTIIIHLMLHVVESVEMWGPVHSYWCFPMER